MKVIFNSIIPFRGFTAINICGLLFARKGAVITEHIITHERIHTKQMKEMLYVGFYLWYIVEWIWRVLFTSDRFSKRAYRNICFEQEAYDWDKVEYYPETRQSFFWINYFCLDF